MIIGVPKEIKNHEYRVGMVPANVCELIKYGHDVIVQSNAGLAIGYTNQDYLDAGASISETASFIFEQAEMIIKIKEPQANERQMLRPNQILFTYLHLAADLDQTHDLINSKTVCIAYETVTDEHEGLPLLAPMSEVAGRMSIQAGAQALEKSKGGSGILLAGVPGVEPATVVIIGAGMVGRNAAKMAIGLGAKVIILDKNVKVLRELDNKYDNKITTVYSTMESLQHYCLQADLVIGAVLIPGAAAPKLVSADIIKQMKKGSAIVDVAIDQGGCFETSKPTTHDEPSFIKDGIVHYCVANMPGAVAKTSTLALTNVTLPYIIALANKGYSLALQDDYHLLNGLNVFKGKITNPQVANALNFDYVEPLEAINRDW